MSVVTDSRPMEDPKDPDGDNVYNLFKYFASPEQDAAMRAKYAAGGFGYGEVKSELYDVLEDTFGAARAKYDAYMADPAQLERILLDGARKARIQGAKVMKRVRKAVGVRADRKLLLEETNG
jgi:tryptophanyl-tRNA synthetase